jgi:lipoate-protein ligase A
VPAVTKLRPEADADAAGPAGVCFQRAEIFDVVNERTGEESRERRKNGNEHGLLFQGSIWRPAADAAADWDRFHDEFVARLARVLGVEARPTPWPDISDDELAAIVEQYSTAEWNEFR